MTPTPADQLRYAGFWPRLGALREPKQPADSPHLWNKILPPATVMSQDPIRPPRVKASRRNRFLCLGVVAAGAMLFLIMSWGSRTVSLVPNFKPRFVRLTRGDVFLESSRGQDYMHRFYVRSSSLAPMSAPLFEQLEDWNLYRGALEKGAFTVCERSVAGSNTVLWIGYDSQIPLARAGAWFLVDRNGRKAALSEPENRTLNNTTRHVWSAVCSEAPHPGEEYALQTGDRRILLFTAPK